ncbi:phospholipase [Nonomuraea sp. 3N208]|uniref:phospholipase n=1 Tax=Nonomuraea sp. 3N208 TaxID=3457421 RepID=UPI003FD2E805
MSVLRACWAGAVFAGVIAVSIPAAADSSALSISREKKLARILQLTKPDSSSLEKFAIAYDCAIRPCKDPYQFDWTTDYCSSAPDKPGGFNFRGACHRHDFGYRNYKKLKAFSKENKLRVDNTFLWDMRRVCERQWGFYEWQRDACRQTAQTYYSAVRATGHL